MRVKKPENLQIAHIWLAHNESFWSHLLHLMDWKETDKVPTAGVSATKHATVNFYYNREFIESLPQQHVPGLLKHELAHVVFRHIYSRGEGRNHRVWNVACDLAINSPKIIPTHQLPECGLIPGVRPKYRDENGDTVAVNNELADYIESVAPNLSAEEYYADIMSNKTLREQAGGGDKVEIVLHGDHEGWGGGEGDEHKEIKEAAVRGLIERAVKKSIGEAQANASARIWGNMSQETIMDILASVFHTVSWEDILKRFLTSTISPDRSTSRQRLNRRYLHLFPGSRRDYTSKVGVYVDCSGSVSNEEVEEFIGALFPLSYKIDFDLWQFDTQVHPDVYKIKNRGSLMKFQRKHTGGTDFNAPIQHAKDPRLGYDGIIIMTDGYAPEPSYDLGRARLAWIISSNGELQFGHRPCDSYAHMGKQKKRN